MLRYRFVKYSSKHCTHGESKEACLQRFKSDWAKRAPERREHIRRIVVERSEYQFYGRGLQRRYQHTMTSPDAGKAQVGKGRLTPEQREELRRMINEVNRERRYRNAD